MPTLRFIAAVTLMLVSSSACGPRTRGSASPQHASPTSASASRGGTLFAHNCSACHAEAGAGGRVGPPLREERKRRSSMEIRALIADPQPPMPKLYPSVLSEQDVDDLTAYVESL